MPWIFFYVLPGPSLHRARRHNSMAHQDGAQPGAALQPGERLDQSPFQLQRHCPTGLPMAEYEVRRAPAGHAPFPVARRGSRPGALQPGSGIFYQTEVRAEGEGYLLLEFPGQALRRRAQQGWPSQGWLPAELPRRPACAAEAEGVAARGVVRLARRKQELLSHPLAALFSEEHPWTAGRPDV